MKVRVSPLLLTPQEAAEALRVSQRTLWSWTAPRGSLPCVKIGRSVRYAATTLQEWIAQQQENSSCIAADDRRRVREGGAK